MSKYKVTGNIYCVNEVEADSEDKAKAKFKAEHSYKHDSGMIFNCTVEEVNVIEEDEPKGQVSVYIGHSRIMYFEMDDNELVICLHAKNITIPPHRLALFTEWVDDCRRYANGFVDDEEMKDLNI